MVLYRSYCCIDASESFASFAQLMGFAVLLIAVPMTRGLPENLRNLALLAPFGLVIVSLGLPSPLARCLSAPVLVALGEASFALYMIHHMFFRAFDQVVGHVAPGLPAAVAFAVALIAAIALATVVHYAFERPVRTFLTR